MSHRLAAQFCNEVNNAIRNRDSRQLQSILVLEPPFSPIYEQLIAELRNQYPATDAGSEGRLEEVVRAAVTETGESEDAEGRPVQSWNAMANFLAGWLTFIRDVDTSQLLKAYEAMSDLQSRINTALQHPTKGIIVLDTLIGYAKIFARVAVGLDRQPELAHHLATASATNGERGESLAEKATNIIRQAFITCLNDKNIAPGGIKNGKPDGKKVAVYEMANVCLKILFQSNKLDNCSMIFKNIDSASPPLHFYPARDRVTYLYYLGRYHFINNEFYHAQSILQKAYDESPSHESCMKQRRLILVYLLTANLILGRLPTEKVYSRPEAYDFYRIFRPIAEAIRKGDLETFRRITNLDLSYEYAAKLCRWRVFYQIGNYCEILVWRTLFRKVFLLVGQQPGPAGRAAPTLDLNAVVLAAAYLERRALMSRSMAQADSGPGRRHIAFAIHDFTNTPKYVDPDFDGLNLEPYVHTPDMEEIECLCGSLIVQGFVSGYISYKQKKLAIMGARKAGSAVKAGFPNVWQVIAKRNQEEAGKAEVLGWVKEQNQGGRGRVVRLTHARPAGS
ncbi:hypothetical protein N0V90_002391 [Kalmusia sp. IMI 367209]|nr:hypothetical protein N0V90_002391 [Kalmusia sp. IMI 367209]